MKDEYIPGEIVLLVLAFIAIFCASLFFDHIIPLFKKIKKAHEGGRSFFMCLKKNSKERLIGEATLALIEKLQIENQKLKRQLKFEKDVNELLLKENKRLKDEIKMSDVVFIDYILYHEENKKVISPVEKAFKK